jgi:type I restriction enzyme R subunit
MKAHTLMQAIARANRVYPGKDFGLIVDYNGMLKSLREALAQYALGDEEGGGGEEIVAPIEERVKALLSAIEETEAHLRSLGFDPDRLLGSKGFSRIQAIADGVDAVYTSDESKRRFEIMARQVFVRFKALIMEPAAFTYAERHDNIEAIYKKLEERRDTADVTELLKELHRIVNEAIQTQEEGKEIGEGRLYDLSRIDLEKLRDEFAKKVRRKATALQDIRKVVEDKLALMLQHNPQRMDYYKRYSEIVADYNREKDRVTIEETFAKLVDLANSLDAEQRRAVEEGLSEEELAIFDLLKKVPLGKAERETVKLASRTLLESVRKLIAPLERWTEKEQTQAEVQVVILDHLFRVLPTPPFSDADKQAVAQQVYQYVWAQSNAGSFARSIAV